METAKREAERTRLIAECAIAAAVSKVYEDAIKEDAEQYLGSDDPDKDDAVMRPRSTKERPLTPPEITITYHNALCLSPQIFSFSWGHFNSQEKLKTMLMQNFGVTNKEHYGILWYFWSGQLQPSFNLATGESVGTLNTHAPEFVHSSPSPLQSQDNTV